MLSALQSQQIGTMMDDIKSKSDPIKLLCIANEFEKAGVQTYATELYLKVLHLYPDTLEAVAARLAVFLIAKRYENEGKKEQAISLVRKVTVVTNENY